MPLRFNGLRESPKIVAFLGLKPQDLVSQTGKSGGFSGAWGMINT